MDHDDPESPESLLLAGPVQERLERAAAASPVTYVRADAPPVLILHGDRDVLVPVGQGRALAERLAAVGAPVTFVRLPAAGHGDWDAWQDDPVLGAGALAYDGRGRELIERGPIAFSWNVITDFLGAALHP